MTTADTPLGQATGRRHEAFGLLGARSAQTRFAARWVRVTAVADYIAVLLGACIAYALYYPGTRLHLSTFVSANLLAVFAVYVFRYLHLYQGAVAGPNIRELENLIRGVTIVASGLFLGTILHEKDWRSAWPIGVGSVIVLFILVCERNISLAVLQKARLRGHLTRRILIFGIKNGHQLFTRLQNNPRLGLSCVGLIGDSLEIDSVQDFDPKARILGGHQELIDVACRERIDEVVIADPCIARESVLSIMEQCNVLQVPVSFIPGQIGPFQPWFSFQLLDGIPWARRRQPGFSTLRTFVKRTLDIVVSLFLIMFLLPVFVVLAILVRLDSPGPILFRQDRVGLNGELFSLLKFRSMRADVPKYGHSPSTSDDPRITRIGRTLRRTSLDELPQLFNVLFGEMSLVGPRPEMPFIVARYGPVERGRLAAKPGVTGLWQISHGRSAPIHDNIDYDLFYIEHQNVFLDLAILISTLAAVVRGTGIY